MVVWIERHLDEGQVIRSQNIDSSEFQLEAQTQVLVVQAPSESVKMDRTKSRIRYIPRNGMEKQQ